MAGDWIKMRVDLAEDPAVIAIAAATGLAEDHVVGKLHRLWSWADQQTTDGDAASVTDKWIDRHVSCTGFAQAMQAASWLIVSVGGIRFPKFDKHSGKTGKRRALTARRMELKRDAGSVTKNAHERQLEKRREDIQEHPIIPLLKSPDGDQTEPRKLKPRKSRQLKPKFAIPTLQEVQTYCLERQNGSAPRAFLASTRAKGDLPVQLGATWMRAPSGASSGDRNSMIQPMRLPRP